MGHDDAHRTGIEQPRCMVRLMSRHSYDRRDACRQSARTNLRGGVDIHGVMLHIDEQPIEAAGFGNMRNINCAGLTQANA